MLCLFTLPVFAKATYIYTNHRFNWVKLDGLSKKDAKEMNPNHPYSFTDEQIRAILKEVKLSRSFILKKEVETQDVFSDSAINFLAPKLIDAFRQAKPDEEVVISYLEKNPLFILRNDRITIVRMWVHGTDLHMAFEKLLAKMLGDYDKHGEFSKIVANAKSLRMALAVRDGQSYGSSMDELVIDTNHDFAKTAVATDDADMEGAEPGAVAAKKGESKDAPKTAEPAKPKTAKERLKELNDLRNDGLLTDDEYKEKKKDILKGI
jgi:hypothetical protein